MSHFLWENPNDSMRIYKGWPGLTQLSPGTSLHSNFPITLSLASLLLIPHAPARLNFPRLSAVIAHSPDPHTARTTPLLCSSFRAWLARHFLQDVPHPVCSCVWAKSALKEASTALSSPLSSKGDPETASPEISALFLQHQRKGRV